MNKKANKQAGDKQSVKEGKFVTNDSKGGMVN
jgi:hypothetical protein